MSHETDDKRMAGDYEITHSLRLGDKEITFGENTTNPDTYHYMCSYYSGNSFFGFHTEVFASNDYSEIMEIYGKRIAEQAKHTMEVQKTLPDSQRIYSSADCAPKDYKENLVGKVIVINSDVLRHEYRSGAHQLYVVTGGFGAESQSRGRAVYADKLCTGDSQRFNREDIVGVLKESAMPAWAKEKLTEYQQKGKQKGKEQEHER